MKDDDTKNGQRAATQKLTSGSSGEQARKDTAKTQNRDQKSTNKKRKTLWESFKSQTRFRQIEIVFVAVGAATGIGVLGTYVWSNLQTRWNFQEEQRPRIAVPTFEMVDVTTKSRGITIGHPFAVNVYFINNGKSAARNIYVHRHVLFGKDYTKQLKVEPEDAWNSGYTLEPNIIQVMTAMSVKDTYAVESVYYNPDWVISWDGSRPIIVFGRITYQDSYGKKYCTPFGMQYLENDAFNVISTFGPNTFNVADLCPTDTTK